MKYNDPTLRQILAGEYALGALHGAARARFERLLRGDTPLHRLVLAWQQLLAPLAQETPAVMPPARVLTAIKRRIEAADAPKQASLWQRVGLWRTFSAIGAAAVIVLAIMTTLLTLRPPAAVPPSYVAILQDQTATPALVVTAFKNPWRLNVEPLALPTLRSDQVLQVWAVEKNSGVMRALLAFAPGKQREFAIAESDWKLVKTAHSLAVSIEPAGGTSAAPTTPLLYTGLCINLKGS